MQVSSPCLYKGTVDLTLYGVLGPLQTAGNKEGIGHNPCGNLKKARSIHFTAPVDNRQFEVVWTINDEADGRLLMRFRLTGNY